MDLQFNDVTYWWYTASLTSELRKTMGWMANNINTRQTKTMHSKQLSHNGFMEYCSDSLIRSKCTRIWQITPNTCIISVLFSLTTERGSNRTVHSTSLLATGLFIVRNVTEAPLTMSKETTLMPSKQTHLNIPKDNSFIVERKLDCLP